MRNRRFMQRRVGDVLPGVFEQNIQFRRSFTLSKVDPDARIAYSAGGR